MNILKRMSIVVGAVSLVGIVTAAAGLAEILYAVEQEPSQRKHTDVYRIIQEQEKETQLGIKVRTVVGENYSIENIPLEIVFINNFDEPVRILNAFDSANKKTIFFTVTLRDSNYSPFFTSGGGKIDFFKNSMKYIELKKGEQTAVTISLLDYDLPQETLKPGVYSVTVTYRNQYGENCFRGTLESKPIDLVLVR